MLKSDQNCLVENCVPMSCNNSNNIAKDKILNSNNNNSKKKKHKKNGLINGVTNCQQDQEHTTETVVEDNQKLNGLEISNVDDNNDDDDDQNKKKIMAEFTKLDTNDNISTDFCELLSNNCGNIDGESMACCSSSSNCNEIDQVGCESIINATISRHDIDNLTNNFDKIDLEQTKIDDKRKNLPPINYVQYESELQMPMIMKIIQKDLSEPYSIYTYRYFIHNWPKLCFLAMCEDQCVGAIVCKLDVHRKLIKRGYIAMLAVDQNYRKLGIGSTLVRMAIQEMILGDADEVVLETEVTNKPALQLYEALGFVRDKRLFRYYLNGVDALRLKLWLR